MTPKLSAGAAQMLLPFMEKLALSPKAEQPFNILQALGRATGVEGMAAPSPWQKLMSMVPKYRSPEGLQLYPGNIRGGMPTALEFTFKPQGQPAALGGQLIRGERPEEAYLAYMGNSGTSRMGTGAAAGPMDNYFMDISSPAQRALPLRGMKLPPQEKAERGFREPEDRIPLKERSEYLQAPGVPLAQKQQAADRFLDVLRRSGFKNLAFSAEPGERPRLYEKITGYKAQPQGETTIDDLMGRMSGRMRDSTGRPRPRTPVAPTGELSADHVESALGLSIDEAYDAGLVKEVGPHVFSLTEQGHAAARNWLGGS